ncbi:hypothetical protein SAMN04489761_1843 [Tenacibaculum sp. MAR_2009_124]|uniref:hypothetical protein n=1 Tax=Tenacibaculum sp. MAR_2009_124 TaxID=1250059 RepID=UPI00089C2BF0|nr:hypothetical protein [Tenacibaculum sp. MAR_2009_124]SEB81139.1 hypothetical protein SAMN04489761_1843 [Tenacibaculum sp. MAR_2009_124]
MIVKRLKEVITYKGISTQEFSNGTNLNTEELESILNGNTPVNERFLKSVLESYPEINANWLILGEGEMIEANNNWGKYVKNLDQLVPEEILDYILTNSSKFRGEPKIDAIVDLFSNFEQQRELQKMYDKIERYEKLLEDKIGD